MPEGRQTGGAEAVSPSLPLFFLDVGAVNGTFLTFTIPLIGLAQAGNMVLPQRMMNGRFICHTYGLPARASEAARKNAERYGCCLQSSHGDRSLDR
jgi:hypothetical protein